MTLINSPLKRLNVSGSPPRSKLFVEWSNLTSIADYLVETSQDPIKYYRELYCLNVNEQIQSEAIQRLTRDDLLGSLKVTLFGILVPLPQIQTLNLGGFFDGVGQYFDAVHDFDRTATNRRIRSSNSTKYRSS